MDDNVVALPGGQDHEHSEHHEPHVTHSTMLSSVEATIEALRDKLTPADDAAVTLCRAYAVTMDKVLMDPEADQSARSKAIFIGPQLLKALESIGATPQSRGELVPEEGQKPVTIDDLLGDAGSAPKARTNRKRRA